MTWQTYAANTARIVAPNRGILIEGQRTNSIRNPRGEGGTAFPLNWSIFAASGVTTSIAGRGTQDGRDYADIRFTGTTTNTFFVQVFDNSAASITAGQAATGSVWVSLAAGSLSGISDFSLALRWSTGANSFQIYTVTTVPQRFVLTATAPATTTSVFWSYGLNFAAGVTLDCTLRFSWPQLETNASFASTPILPPAGTPGASTRGADLVTVPLSSLGIGSNGACTVLWSGVFLALAGTQQTIAAVDDNTTANRCDVRLGGGGVPEIVRVTGGVASLQPFGVAAVTPGTTIRAGMTLDGAGRFAAMFPGFAGGAVQAVTGTPTSGLTTFRHGTSQGGVRELWGTTTRLTVLPRAMSDAELQAAVAALPSP